MNKFKVNFTEEQLAKGEKLLPGATVIFGGPDRLEAEVQDQPQLFTVKLSLQDRKLVFACDCPQTGACPHVWTALRLAEQSGDLQLALKRNVPMRFGNPSQPPPDQELQYQKEKTRPASDESSYSQAVHHPVPAPLKVQLDTQTNTQILFVLPLELQPPQRDALCLELYWRQATRQDEKPFPAKPLILEEQSVIDSPAVAFLIRHQKYLDHKSFPLHAHLLPLADFPSFTDTLDARSLLRWTSINESPRKLHPLTISHKLPAELDIQFLPTANQGFMSKPVFADIPPEQVLDVFPPNLILTRTHLQQANFQGVSLEQYRNLGRFPLTSEQAQRLVRKLTIHTSVQLDMLPPELRPELLSPKPHGRLYIRTAVYKYQGHEQLHAILSFDYDTVTVDEFESQSKLNAHGGNALILRDAAAEDVLKLRLQELGFRFNNKAGSEELGWKLHPSRLDEAVKTLIMEDWFITAEGKTYRKPQVKQAVVKSGMDWFDLEGEVDFDGMKIPLPELLKAQSSGDKAVRLDDGTYGLLPLEWLQNFTVLTELGEQVNDAIRFKMQQAALVETLLEEQAVQFDAAFKQKALEFQEVVPVPATPPEDFQATLRPYQCEGLGWLLAMCKMQFGACLADDMGLGKTIQILALLDTRKAQHADKPSLVVVPKSLLFNWEAEARRFAPRLRVLVHAGSGRSCAPGAFQYTDIVLMTYGTLRNDALKLAKLTFDYCILDESQTIKNAHAAAAEAVRLIKADHRIAMTGTPIENSLSELASQLEFLNPGLFGSLLETPAFAANGQIPEKTIVRIRKAVHPFILRRTKQQVAKDLPPKTELVLWCELDENQRNEYEEIRKYYQQQLLGKEDEKVAGQSTMDTLVALLRLRQTACHPALLDDKRSGESSAKLDLIIDKIAELSQDHHKVLVFSQFTTFLKLVASRLQTRQLKYNYLDGQTPDRQAQVSSFQNDNGTCAFLISLKAGGVGLNLTVADYIFLLDPWWNPATEMQAIDRAYRIGQNKHVFAYKVIAKDTIEEKVLQMQENKKHLADAVLNNENTGLPPRFTKEDLEYLLS